MIGERIKQARIASGMTQDEAVESLASLRGPSLTKAGLSKYERGGSVPKPVMLRALGQVFGVPADFFLEEPHVSVRWLAFRKGSTLKKAEERQVQTVAAAQVEAFVTLLRALEPGRERPTPKLTKVRTLDEAEKAADTLRSAWRLGDQPIESVTTAIEDSGGLVLELGGEDDVFDGLSGWADDVVPVVVVSRWVADDRRRFSLAHELGHLYMHIEGADRKTEERLAHRFAAAFLVPAKTARRELGEKRRHLDFRELAILKRKHGLSIQAWIMRAADLGIIDQGHARTLFTRLSARGWRKEEPVSFEGRERPLRLRQLAVRALAEGLLTRSQAERMCPQALADIGDDGPPAPGSMDARTLLKLRKEERERLMEQAATLLEGDYQEGSSLTGFDALSEEDHCDKPVKE